MKSLTFSERVVKLALSIPPGRVTTYGAIAQAAGPAHSASHNDSGRGGAGMAAMSVTNILAKAYRNGQTTIPFHRIVYSDGLIWTSPEYHQKRLKLYKKEGIEIDAKNRIKNFPDILLTF